MTRSPATPSSTRKQPRLRRAAALATVVLGALGSAGSASAQSFSVDDVLSTPFPDHLVAGQSQVAWVSNDRGERNLWLANAPGYEGRQLTDYEGDNGQEITNLSLTRDGGWVVFVRGGAPNRSGEIPNPTSDPEWPDRAIYALRLDSAEASPIRLGEGSAPAVAPGGDLVAFTSQGKIWTVAIADSAKAKEIATVRGGPGQLRWSPDGSKLAFVSRRGDHGFVGVVDVDSGGLTYMAPSVDNDGSPVWAPNSDRVAFIRSPNVRKALPFEPRREGHPWSIVIAEVETGVGEAIWTADPGTGSVFYGLEAVNPLWWGADNRIVFPWERNGWLNLYSVSVGGGEVRPLTTGAFEVEYASLSPNGRDMVFASNQDDIDRRHLWRVPVDGSEAAQLLTPGEGLEWSPVLPESEVVVYLASGATTPAHARVLGESGSRPLNADAIPARFPSTALVEPEAVVFSRCGRYANPWPAVPASLGHS